LERGNLKKGEERRTESKTNRERVTPVKITCGWIKSPKGKQITGKDLSHETRDCQMMKGELEKKKRGKGALTGPAMIRG